MLMFAEMSVEIVVVGVGVVVVGVGAGVPTLQAHHPLQPRAREHCSAAGGQYDGDGC